MCFFSVFVLQEVRIQDRQVLLGSGFPAPVSIPILFEETFYNDREQSYSILCVSRPMEMDPSLSEVSTPSSYSLRSLEDVREFLGRHAQKMDKHIQSFCQAFREQERKGLRHHIVGMTDTKQNPGYKRPQDQSDKQGAEGNRALGMSDLK